MCTLAAWAVARSDAARLDAARLDATAVRDVSALRARDRQGAQYDLTSFAERHPGGEIVWDAQDRVLEDVWEENGVEWHAGNAAVRRVLDAHRSR